MNKWPGRCIVVLCGIFLVFSIAEQAEALLDDGVYDPAMEAHQKNIPWVSEQYKQNQQKFAGDDEIMVRHGLVASRRDKNVQVYADSTGLNDGDTIEFYLIGQDSSHAYEALLISFASPSDIRDALTFIGMQPGRGVDYDKLCFWPKGERVKISVSGATTNSSITSFPLENLLWDYVGQKSIMSDGFVFTGSTYLPKTETDGEMVLAAEEFDPHSIVSDYNENSSLLDIPFRASKGEAYGDNTVNVQHKLELGELLKLTMQPEFTNGVKRVLNLKLRVNTASTNITSLADLTFELIGDNSTNAYDNITGLLVAFNGMVDNKKDPFVTLDFNRNLSLKACHLVSMILGGIDSEGGIRIDPPQAGDLHFRAFIPDESMRARDKRYMQPLELHLKLLEGEIDATVIKVNEIWGVGNTPKLDPVLFPVSFHDSLKDTVSETDVEHPVLLIFPDERINLGALLDYIEPIRESHKYIHIYLPKEDR